MVFPEGSSVMQTTLSLAASTSPCGQGREVGLEKGKCQFGEIEPKGCTCDLQKVPEQMLLFLSQFFGLPREAGLWSATAFPSSVAHI